MTQRIHPFNFVCLSAWCRTDCCNLDIGKPLFRRKRTRLRAVSRSPQIGSEQAMK